MKGGNRMVIFVCLAIAGLILLVVSAIFGHDTDTDIGAGHTTFDLHTHVDHDTAQNPPKKV